MVTVSGGTLRGGSSGKVLKRSCRSVVRVPQMVVRLGGRLCGCRPGREIGQLLKIAGNSLARITGCVVVVVVVTMVVVGVGTGSMRGAGAARVSAMSARRPKNDSSIMLEVWPMFEPS